MDFTSFYYIFSIGCTRFFSCRGRRLRRPAKKHKGTFLLLALFSDKKRGKSHLRGLSALLKNTLRVHELVARAVRASACGKGQSENRQFCALHGFVYTTRANKAHEIAEQIRARIACTPA